MTQEERKKFKIVCCKCGEEIQGITYHVTDIALTTNGVPQCVYTCDGCLGYARIEVEHESK